MALPVAMSELGLDMESALKVLTKESGLLGLSGVSNDIRDIAEAADSGNKQARMAMDFLVAAIRHWIGAFAFQMGGLDAIVFTAGIGENQVQVREAACAGLENFGIQLDPRLNTASASGERDLSASGSRVRIFVIPTNEERVVARETRRLIEKQGA
jgi:acetate kinase